MERPGDPVTDDREPHRLAVLGAGVMGTNITTLALGHGVPVTLIDVDQARLGEASELIARQLRMARLMNALPEGVETGELRTGAAVEDVVDATAVIEAVTEDAGIKAEVLAKVSAVVRPGTLIVSNTSSIPIDELAASVPDPGRLVGVHFMNPTYLIPTVEVIRGPRTADSAMAAVTALLTAVERRPIEVNDGPGFVTSRILHRMINDAVRVVEEGRASAESVDALMQGCLGHRTGPLRTADLIGLDNLADSLRVLHERTGDEGFRPAELLVCMVSEGKLGRKNGRGFYEYGEAS
ncbi:3-hydroxyacyl-CoA dehydrogenase family protein [Kitasatospora sp. NPDC051705]|uniref:3-hydroxyacyl-CoA dehydrogenase family protein n=1 Tax=Kitasatospora sp. NPDC051705 TaxID=3364057 RepID=UPI0037918DB2